MATLCELGLIGSSVELTRFLSGLILQLPMAVAISARRLAKFTLECAANGAACQRTTLKELGKHGFAADLSRSRFFR